MGPLLLRKQRDSQKSGFTIVVSKRIDKRASGRNRMKRLVRESVRHLFPAGIKGTIIVKQNIAKKTQQEVEKLVSQLFHETNNS